MAHNPTFMLLESQFGRCWLASLFMQRGLSKKAWRARLNVMLLTYHVLMMGSIFHKWVILSCQCSSTCYLLWGGQILLCVLPPTSQAICVDPCHWARNFEIIYHPSGYLEKVFQLLLGAASWKRHALSKVFSEQVLHILTPYESWPRLSLQRLAWTMDIMMISEIEDLLLAGSEENCCHVLATKARK